MAFPKLFHLATLNLVDDWDDDACSQVSVYALASVALPYPALEHVVAFYAVFTKTCSLDTKNNFPAQLNHSTQVSERVLESPEALSLDPSVFVMAIQSCVAMHGIAQKVSCGNP